VLETLTTYADKNPGYHWLTQMKNFLLDYFRCPELISDFRSNGPVSDTPGFFRWGDDAICYGRSSTGFSARRADVDLYDVSADVHLQESSVVLPFDPAEVIENLLRERYSAHFREPGSASNAAVRKVYYLLRPYLSVPLRKHLQKIRLRGWDRIRFPHWPIDTTVDRLQRRLLSSAMRAKNLDKVPFIWFWPDGFDSCAIVTHDVETADGRDFSGKLMDLDESFGFRSSFQLVPESRYEVSDRFVSSIWNRGFEVNVHDLKHDGRLYAEQGEFLRRAQLINQYARKFGASGFRSGVLYRNADWYSVYDFEYDMSIPNVAHLDPQRGGCCTVMPYFIEGLVELPVTCMQDYTLFHMLGDYSIDLWKRQIDLITASHGLVSILTHPDYLMEARAQNVYKQLLRHLARMREDAHMWTPLPGEVANWWRQRSQMKLTCDEGTWRIEGQGSERARIAYACVDGDEIKYSLQPASADLTHSC